MADKSEIDVPTDEAINPAFSHRLFGNETVRIQTTMPASRQMVYI